jgi:ecdysteroid 25-hydroxylase CYP306A1
MDFILTGKAESHKLYDAIADNCVRALDTSTEYRDCILKRFLLEKRDREERHDGLAGNCSRVQCNHLLADIFGASLDTTLGTLRWYLLLLATHRDCQRRIYEEMVAYGIKDSYVLNDVDGLPYLRASIAESMRLKSVVPCGIPHGNSNEQTTLGGYTIPKNSMVSTDCIELF